LIQSYLRERGFLRAEVEFTQVPDDAGALATVTFKIKPGEQVRISSFKINVDGFDDSPLKPLLRLQPGVPFTREALNADFDRVRQAIILHGHLAPRLSDPSVVLDSTNYLVEVAINGALGPRVEVESNDPELKEKTLAKLLPIKHEGTIEQSAIVEGERRLRNKLQEDGYFFAEVSAICTVTAPVSDLSSNGTNQTCENLNPDILGSSAIKISYNVERGRRLKLAEIRIKGTDKITYEDVADILRTQKANILGFIPAVGYGRGFTSRDLIKQDEEMLKARLRELGYLRVSVNTRVAASLNGEDLIITFDVQEGPLTRVAGIAIRGNRLIPESELRSGLETVLGGPFSRFIARTDGDKILNHYASQGYITATLDFSVEEIKTRSSEEDMTDEQVKLVYTVRSEGEQVVINRVLVNISGTANTKTEAVVKAVPLHEGDLLRIDKLNESERLLYATGAFRQVTIRREPAGETASGQKKFDVIIDLEESKPRTLEYGGGYSTDNGPLGVVELRNDNLFGSLKQSSARLRASRRQQLGRLEYIDPRFFKLRNGQFSPLSLSLQYQADSNVTRFFRSTLDRGNNGIVQTVDKNGNPIDVNCSAKNETAGLCAAGVPTINRFTFNAETSWLIQSRSRSSLFVRYAFEDVRLFNLNSLLIAPILVPDRSVQLSRLGATFVRDTRQNCGSNSLNIWSASQPPNASRCVYSQTDATTGDFLTIDYSLALRELGGNISFNKFQGSYRRYYQLKKARGTVLAGNITFGIANVIRPLDRDGNHTVDETDRLLPISERFFSGGSTTLRGFRFEEAGPREVITFSNGQTLRTLNGQVTALKPFLVPIGGNAMAVLNLEARLPLSKEFQLVPFYDGGNVFRDINDMFRKISSTSNKNFDNTWSHTGGLGLRINTPIGGSIAIDYGLLLKPPRFALPQPTGPDASIILRRTQFHFRFTQTF
jgi:outer membrane protein insertion porin family